MGRRCLILALTALLLTGCAGSPDQSAAALAPAESDRIVIYTSHKEEVYGPIVKEFEARTGIWAEVVTRRHQRAACPHRGRGGRASVRRDLRRRRGEPDGLRALLSALRLRRGGPDPPGLRPADDLWTPFSSLPVVLIYNTKLVSPGELTGWESLLSGRWSGSIALADPTVSGLQLHGRRATMLCALPGDDWSSWTALPSSWRAGSCRTPATWWPRWPAEVAAWA